MPVARALRSLPAATASDVLVLAVLAGALGGMAEAARALWRQRVRHFPTGAFTEPEVVWMAPLAAITLLVLVGIVLIVLDRIVRSEGLVLRAGPPLMAALAVYSLLRSLQLGLANIAALILAAGVAAMVVRLMAARPAAVRRLARRAAIALVVLLAAWAVAIPLRRNAAESRLLAVLPEAQAGTPNVLLVIWDAVRAQSLSLYGYDRATTPVLDEFAGSGAVFERAYATSPWSLPSHSSMFTGRYPPEMSAARQAPLDDTYPTLAGVLAGHGYATGGFTANIYYGSSAFGIARGFSRYEAHPPLNAGVIAGTWWLTGRLHWELIGRREWRAPGPMRPRASDINQSLLRWIDRRDDRPFFAVINHFDAHDPYYPPEPFSVAFSPTRPRYWLEDEHVAYDAGTLRDLVDAYDSAILYLDHELGRLLDALRERGVLDNTVVIVTSDHGEEFGEYAPDIVKHARTLYAPALHVPLVVVHPQTVPAARVDATVSIRDIPATVMDVLGLADASPFPGTSLRRYADGTVTEEEATEPRLAVAESSPMGGVLPTWPIAAGDMFALMDGDLQYILDGAGRERLFDLSDGGTEIRDFANDPALQVRLSQLRATLDSLAPVEDGVRRAFLRRRR